MKAEAEILNRLASGPTGLAVSPWGASLDHAVDVHPSWFRVPQGVEGLRDGARNVSQALMRFFGSAGAGSQIALSRAQLFEFAKSEDVTDEEFAVLVFMWGCGPSDFNVKAFTESVSLDVVSRFVAECRSLARTDARFDADLLGRLRSREFYQLNLSFGSKILYFSQVKTTNGDHCTIFDKKVSENLDKIKVPVGGKECILSHLIVSHGTADTVSSISLGDYEKICEAFEQLGASAHRRFDDVEYWIFNS